MFRKKLVNARVAPPDRLVIDANGRSVLTAVEGRVAAIDFEN